MSYAFLHRFDGHSKAARVAPGLLTCLIMLLAFAGARAQVTITEINPKQATLQFSGPNGAAGGRVNGLSGVATDGRTFYAASEWGGLYRSRDRGRTWERLDRHLPTATWDVKVSPADPNRVIATSYFDGRVRSLAGINVSTDGGNTWARPRTATPPPNFCEDEMRRSEPSAFGLSFDPADPRKVYAGTNCGLAASTDGGNTWRFIDPTPADPADDVRDVIVHHNGIIDLCGDDGHRRSVDGGARWSTATGNNVLPSGNCSIAASPDESYVLFAVAGVDIFESDDGGASWTTRFDNPSEQGRVPFVATNQRSGAGFDLWFGDTSLHRASCRTPNPAAPGGAPRCPASDQWSGRFTTDAGAHDDAGDIAFDPRGGDDPCPTLFSSDGGVYFNTLTTSPDCHTPKWSQPDVSPRGLWLFALTGADLPGAAAESLYFVNQDTGTFATADSGAGSPQWSTIDCCDGFDVSADPSLVVYTVCCWNPPPLNRLFVRGPGMQGGDEVRNYPAGNIPGWGSVGVVKQFGPRKYVLITTGGVFVTDDITANQVNWVELRSARENPPVPCGVKVATSGGTPTFYVQSGACNGRGHPFSGGDGLWKYVGAAPGGTWKLVRPPQGVGGFGVFDVHPTNPKSIIASHLSPAGVRMVISNDGGVRWSPLPVLDRLMTGGGTFKYMTRLGPTDFGKFDGYPQPSLVAFDPSNPRIVVAGGMDSGIFYSADGGATWRVITNNSGTASNVVIPRPRFAYFDHEDGTLDIYIGTQGRGAWRVRMPNPT